MENKQNAIREFSLSELRSLYKRYGYRRYKMSMHLVQWFHDRKELSLKDPAKPYNPTK